LAGRQAGRQATSCNRPAITTDQLPTYLTLPQYSAAELETQRLHHQMRRHGELFLSHAQVILYKLLFIVL
jgi:hypothetical protein